MKIMLVLIPAILFAADPAPAPIPLTPDQRIAYLEKALAAANARIEVLGLQIKLANYREQSRQALERQKTAEQLVVQNYEAGFNEAYQPAAATFQKAEADRAAAAESAKKKLKVAEGWTISPDGKEFRPPAAPPSK